MNVCEPHIYSYTIILHAYILYLHTVYTYTYTSIVAPQAPCGSSSWPHSSLLPPILACRFGSNQRVQTNAFQTKLEAAMPPKRPVPRAAMPPKRPGPHAKASKKQLEFRIIRSIKARAETISKTSNNIETLMGKNAGPIEKIVFNPHRRRIEKMGQNADLILKTIYDGQAKLDYINSGQAARDEWKKQRAAEEQQEREEKENQEAASRGEAPPARKRPAGATDFPLAAGYVPIYQRKNQPLFSEPLVSDSEETC